MKWICAMVSWKNGTTSFRSRLLERILWCIVIHFFSKNASLIWKKCIPLHSLILLQKFKILFDHSLISASRVLEKISSSFVAQGNFMKNLIWFSSLFVFIFWKFWHNFKYSYHITVYIVCMHKRKINFEI